MVICTGDHWAFDLRGIRDNPIDDGNTAYAWHVYAGHEANDPARWAERLDDLHLEHPVIVTEWGFCSKIACKDKHYYGTAQTFGRNFVKFMDERYLPWTAWVWVPWWGDLNLVASDWRSLTEWGMFVKNALAQGQQSRP
jgi:hypothetical protein